MTAKAKTKRRRSTGPTARQIFDRYNAALQAEAEALAATPAGKSATKAWNDAVLERLRAKRIGKNPRRTRGRGLLSSGRVRSGPGIVPPIKKRAVARKRNPDVFKNGATLARSALAAAYSAKRARNTRLLQAKISYAQGVIEALHKVAIISTPLAKTYIEGLRDLLK